MSRKWLVAHNALAACAVALALSACGGSSSGGQTSLRSTPATHQLDDQSNGTTLEAHVGDTIVVTLHSTLWTLDVPKAVLQASGAPQTAPSHCAVMGSGCGTVTQSYSAGQAGQTTLHAHRDSCGEALRCTAKQSDWTVSVHVT